MKHLILFKLFDAHMHWRQKVTLLHKVAKYSMNQFSGGLLMPNTNPNIFTFKELEWYVKQVLIETSDKAFFTLFTYSLSSRLTKDDLDRALEFEGDNFRFGGVKYYPKGGTTNSGGGMTGFDEVAEILKYMQERRIPLLIHGEVSMKDSKMIDDFDREKVFYESEMELLRSRYPELLLVMEHITTQESVEFVMRHKNIRATITPQHLLFDRRALFNGVTTNDGSFYYDPEKNGISPVFMCRPILKETRHVNALRNVLIQQDAQGFKKFGLGTDTAPHTADKKYCECGACGVYSAPIALELYAMAFEEMGILPHFQTFAEVIMPEFYGIKGLIPSKKVELVKKPQLVEIDYDGIVTPFAGQEIPWSVVY